MSYIDIDRAKTIAAPVIYVVYGSVQNAKEGELRAALVTAVTAEGLRQDDWAGVDFIDEGNELLKPHTQRSNKCLTFVQSWSVDELDKDNPEDVQRAHALGAETARRLAPNSPFLVATHIDSDGGCVHNRIIILNHDHLTAKAAPKQAGNFHNVKRVNDELMAEVGLEVLQPQGSWVKLRQSEKAAAKAGISTDSTGLGLHELNGYTWADAVRRRVDSLLEDKRVCGASGTAEGLEVAQKIASEYDLSLVVNEHDALTIGLVDEAGETLTYESGVKRKRTRRAVDAGSKFGSGYALEGIQQRIQEQQQRHWFAVQQQARLAGLVDITNEIGDIEDETEIATTIAISGRNRTAGVGLNGTTVRGSRDAGEVAENSGAETEGTSAGAGEYRTADRESGTVGTGTSALRNAAAAAKRAAAAVGANDGRDARVQRSAAGGSGDDRSDYLHVDEHGAEHEPDTTNAVGIVQDVPRDVRNQRASRAVVERRRRERQQRIKQAIDFEFE